MRCPKPYSEASAPVLAHRQTRIHRGVQPYCKVHRPVFSHAYTGMASCLTRSSYHGDPAQVDVHERIRCAIGVLAEPLPSTVSVVQDVIFLLSRQYNLNACARAGCNVVASACGTAVWGLNCEAQSHGGVGITRRPGIHGCTDSVDDSPDCWNTGPRCTQHALQYTWPGCLCFLHLWIPYRRSTLYFYRGAVLACGRCCRWCQLTV